MLVLVQAHALASGGLDSTTLLYHYRGLGLQATAHFVDYGQWGMQPELASLRRVCGKLDVPIRRHKASLPSPVGPGEILNRNQALIDTVVSSLRGAAIVGLGIHAGSGYQDTTPEFVTSIQDILDQRFHGCVNLDVPFLLASKQQVAAYAQELGVNGPATYSCEEGDPDHCGVCPSCQDRKALFASGAMPGVRPVRLPC